MPIKLVPKIWLGIGVAAAIGSHANVSMAQSSAPSATAPTASPDHAQHSAQPAATSNARPDGEGGEAGGAGLDPRIKFLRDMGLVRGHLLVGNELVKEGRFDDALPHFHHPIEELYAGIGPRLKGQGVRQFDAQLKALAQAVQAKNAGAYANAWKVVDQRMTEAETTMRKFETPKIAARIATVMAILESAGKEYGEAIENAKIAKPVEYQDSRGFVLYADKLFETIAPELQQKNSAAVASTRAALKALKAAWPTAVPPEKPVLEHSAVLAAISQVELASSALSK